MEPRQCTASVFEALMGFDEQQSQHHAPRNSRVLSDGYLQRAASIGSPKKKAPSRCHPVKMTMEESTEFFNSLKVEDNFSHCNVLSDRGKADSALSAAYMPRTRHHFMNEKHFSTVKVIQTSKNFQDLPEVVDSMDISPRPKREKNKIFKHDENGPSVSKSHYTLTEGTNDAGTKFKDRKQGKARWSEDLDHLKSSRAFLERRDKLYFSSSSPTSLKGSRLDNDKCKYSGEKERTLEYALQPIKQPSQVSNILDGSRRKTRNGFVNLHSKTSRSESLCAEVCRKEIEDKRTSSSGLSNCKTGYKSSCLLPVKPYKTRESGEKVIEEQRKTENLLLFTQGRKMNEMCILPRYATLPSDLNCKPVKYNIQNIVCSNEEHLHSGSPLCLSCKDKRLNQVSKSSHRLPFDSASAVTARSRTRSRYEALRNTWFLKPEGVGTWLQCKPLNRSSNNSESASKLISKKLKIFPCPDSSSDHVDHDGCMVDDDLKTRVEKNGLCDQHPLKRESHAIKCSLKSNNQDNSGSASNALAVKTDDVEVLTVDKQEPDPLSGTLLETNDDTSTNTSRATSTSIQQVPYFSH